MCVHMQGHITIFNMVFHISLIEEGTSEQRLEGSERVREMPRYLSEDCPGRETIRAKALRFPRNARGPEKLKGNEGQGHQELVWSGRKE